MLGSLDRSALAGPPSGPILAISPSSRLIHFALPHAASAIPLTLKGTIGVYWCASASTKPFPLAGVNPVWNWPLRYFRWKKPLRGLNTFCQFCARAAGLAALDLGPG